MDKCVEDDCLEYDERRPSNCKLTLNVTRCPAHCLTRESESGAKLPCSGVLVAKLIKIDSLIRCVHLDMGGNDKYHISPRHNDQIGKLIKECLYIAEGN